MNNVDSSISDEKIKRAWRVVTWAGLLGTCYYILCINGAPRIRFLTELNATAFDFGLIAGLGSFAIIFQVFASLLNNRLKRRKALWMCITITHRILFSAVLVAPVLFLNERWRIWWIIIALFLHDSLVHLSSPIWLSWMADLLPSQTMTRHWATRQRTITALKILVMAGLAYGFNHFEKTGQVILGFTLFASLGIGVGIIDILMFSVVPEPPNTRIRHGTLKEVLLQPLKDPQFRPFLVFMSYFRFAVGTAAPFFGLYMIGYLKLTVLTVQLLGVSAALGITLSSRFWGLLCDTYGYRPTLQILSIAKLFTPLVFLLTPGVHGIFIPILAIYMFFDGVMNSGVMLAMQGVLLRSTPRRNRTMYIASANFLSLGVMAALAPIFAGGLIDVLNQRMAINAGPYTFTGYHAVFLLSVLLRSLAFPLASRIYDPHNVPLRVVLRQFRSLNSYRVAQWVYRLHESSDEKKRLKSARILGGLRNPMAISDLINALRDSSRDVRQAAADSLGMIGHAEASEPLAAALFEPDSGIQSAAARALGKIGGFHSLKALLNFLKDQRSEALTEAIDSLARIGHYSAVLPLICLFHDVEDESLHRRIAVALGTFSETNDYEEVMNMLRGRRAAME